MATKFPNSRKFIPHGNGIVYYFKKKRTRDYYTFDYDYDDLIHYEGELKNGGPHGENITTYFTNGRAWFHGSMKEGWFDGFGTDFFNDGKIRHQGFYQNGGPHGENVEIHPYRGFSTGYCGRMIEGKREGFGKEIDENKCVRKIGFYEKDQLAIDKGAFYNNNGKMWHRGYKGFGIMYYGNGQIDQHVTKDDASAGFDDKFGKKFVEVWFF